VISESGNLNVVEKIISERERETHKFEPAAEKAAVMKR